MDKNSILGADDLPSLKVDTPEWKDCPAVYVRMMSAAESVAMTEFSKSSSGDPAEDEKLAESFLWRFAAFVLCDEDGKRLFDNDDLTALRNKSPIVLARIMDAAITHNHLSTKAHEEAVKNSDGDPTTTDT